MAGLSSKFGGKFCLTEKWVVAGNNLSYLSFIYLQDKKQVNNNDLGLQKFGNLIYMNKDVLLYLFGGSIFKIIVNIETHGKQPFKNLLLLIT